MGYRRHRSPYRRLFRDAGPAGALLWLLLALTAVMAIAIVAWTLYALVKSI